MARNSSENTEIGIKIATGDILDTITASGQETIALPGDEFVRNAEILRDGQDLVLEAPNGDIIVIEGYFNAEPAPMLVSVDGAALTPELVGSFVQNVGSIVFADAGTMNDQSPVGAVQEVSGSVKITRGDGTTENVSIGTPVYQGDVIETEDDGAVNIVFVDESSFAVSSNAKLAIDEFMFDTVSESGVTNISILRGVFLFTSGLIGRDDPDDVAIDTPMGSIGIRGTIIAGNADTGEITVLEGAIVLRALNGSEVTLSQQFETARFDPAGGDVTTTGTMAPENFTQEYNAVKTVAPALFSSFDAEQPQPEQNDGTPEPQNAPQQSPENGDDGASLQPSQQQQPPADSSTYADTSFDGGQDASFGDSAGTDTRANADPLLQTTQNAGSGTTATTTTAPPPPPPSGTNDPLSTTTTTTNPPPSGTGGTNPPANTFNGLDLGHVISMGYTVSGFFIDGAASSHLGASVAGIGDYDGDGLNDAIISEDLTSGNAYLVDGLGNNLFTEVYGLSPSHNAIVAGLGDVDGDGVIDYALSTPDSTTPIDGGYVEIVSSNITFSIMGQDAGTGAADQFGRSVAGIGDINGDGFNDILIGAPGQDDSAADAGAAYIIFGGETNNLISDISSGISPTQGFTIDGIAPGDMLGSNVSAAGDLNNDGYSDFAIAEPGQDRVHILFGGQGMTGATLGGGSLQIDGFNVDSGDMDIPMFNMGDLNGDGITDMAFASTGGGSDTLHIFSGTTLAAAGTGTSINAFTNADSLITADGGREIIGGGGAGDFNGDGRDDGVVAFRNGDAVDIFVIYGGTAFSTDFSASTLLSNPAMGFHMKLDLNEAGIANPSSDEFHFEFAAAGDMDGDGYEDLIIGTPDYNNGSGGYFTIYGRDEEGTVNTSGTATSAFDSLVGTVAADSISVNGFGSVNVNAGDGNDTIYLNSNLIGNVDGGAGIDTLLNDASGLLDLSNVGSERLKGIEGIQYMGSGQTVNLDLSLIFTLMQESQLFESGGNRVFMIEGGSGNYLNIELNSGAQGTTGIFSDNGAAGDPGDIQNAGFGIQAVAVDDSNFYSYSFGSGYELWIDAAMVDANNVAII